MSDFRRLVKNFYGSNIYLMRLALQFIGLSYQKRLNSSLLRMMKLVFLHFPRAIIHCDCFILP